MCREDSTTVSVAEESGDKHEVKTLKRFQITLDGGLCKKCNNERLGGLEQLVQPILPCCRPSYGRIFRRQVVGFSPSLGEGGLPGGAVGQDVHESLGEWHVVTVGGGDALPLACRGVVGGVEVEHGHEPGLAGGAVVGEGLAGPFAADEDAASGVAEVLVAVGFTSAETGDQARAVRPWAGCRSGASSRTGLKQGS